MNSTLNLVDHVLALGRRYQEVGRHRDAVALLTRLSGFRELSAGAAEETQARLAELHLKRRRFRRARRHLTVALRHQPASARYHYLLATAVRAEDRGDLERADGHYRSALDLDPNHVKCLADHGLLLIRLGRADEGVARLRQAADKAPDDAEVLGKLVKGLRLTGRGDEARRALQAALFRNGRSPRFRKLWDEFCFQQARQRRQTESRRRGQGDAADEPVLLPFVPVSADRPVAGCPSVVPHPGSLPRRTEQRNVQ
jgi:Tfp pilus assembly protein PilF